MTRSMDLAAAKSTSQPLLRVAAERVGLRRAFRVLSYVVAWDMAREAVGHAPSTEEYAEHWRENDRTAYRDASLFREAFPQWHDPEPLLALAREQAKDRTSRAFGNVLIPT